MQYVLRILYHNFVCVRACVCVWCKLIAQESLRREWGVADGAPVSFHVRKLGYRWGVGKLLKLGCQVAASPMALLFPISIGVAGMVPGKIFAASQQSALDEDVLLSLRPSLIINLTRRPCPGCALSCPLPWC